MVVAAQWARQQERGSILMLRVIVWIALHAGHRAARALLGPICLYFLLVPAQWQRASRDYLNRVLPRRAGMIALWRHCHCFATCLLDRVFLLNGQVERFDISVQGAECVTALQARGEGCLLLGAHLGSFEVCRAAGHALGGARISLVMYAENARKVGTLIRAINPAQEMDIIALGQPGGMLRVRDRLDQGHLVGMLADRGLDDERRVRLAFLGAPAWFPEGPFRLAALLGRPAILMLGIHRGGKRYDIVFEDLGETGDVPALMQRYVARLEQHCRAAPYNWFNFYPFWD